MHVRLCACTCLCTYMRVCARTQKVPVATMARFHVCILIFSKRHFEGKFYVHLKYKVVPYKWRSKWVFNNTGSPQTKRSIKNSSSILARGRLLLWLLAILLLVEAFFRPPTPWVCFSNTLQLLLEFVRLSPSVVLVVPQTCAHLQHPYSPPHHWNLGSLSSHVFSSAFLVLWDLVCHALLFWRLLSHLLDGWHMVDASLCHFGGTQCPWWRAATALAMPRWGWQPGWARGVNLSGFFAPILTAI